MTRCAIARRKQRGPSTGVRTAALAALVVATLCCGSEPPPTDAATAPLAPAPTQPAATLVLDTPLLAVGDVAVAELAVVTPAGARVLPHTPAANTGLWLLDRSEEVLEVGPGRWLHSTRFRVRAREVGVHVWPATTVVIEHADGETEELDVPQLEFEVASTLDAFPARDRPFGPIDLEPQAAGGFQAASFAAGVVSGCLALAALGLVRRRRAAASTADGQAATPVAASVDLSELARRELAQVRARAEDEPLLAADLASRLLRRHLEHRFGVEALHKTREQLAEIRLPLGAKRSWPEVMRILRNLDELRFRPVGSGGRIDPAALEACLRDIEAFTAPRVSRR